MSLNLVFTGGGTAGHVLPNLALVESETSPLRRLYLDGGLSVHYIGSKTGIERNIVAASRHHFQYHPISSGRLRRFFTFRNFLTPFSVARGFLQSRRVLKNVSADALFSKGGFVSAPAVWAAASLGIPIVIHESDLSPALTTKLSLPFCSRIFCAFEETLDMLPPNYRSIASCVGIPLRSSLFGIARETAIDHFSLDAGRCTLLCFGGSLGARVLNQAVRNSLVQLCRDYNVIHIVGRGNVFSVRATGHYRQYEYLGDEMPLALAAADLALCRAGASSIFELAALRVPMILVPLDLDQSRGDQIENAAYFERRGWARVIREHDLSPRTLIDTVVSEMAVLDKKRKALCSAPANSALQDIASELIQIMRN